MEIHTEAERVHKESLRSLDPFLGTWTGRGTVYDDGGKATPVTAAESFEILEGGYFVVHRWHWKYARSHFSGIELIGFERESRSFFATLYDNHGHRLQYRLHREGNEWHYDGEQQRARMQFGEGTFAASWERSPDGRSWRPLCEMDYEKARARRAMGFHRVEDEGGD